MKIILVISLFTNAVLFTCYLQQRWLTKLYQEDRLWWKERAEEYLKESHENWFKWWEATNPESVAPLGHWRGGGPTRTFRGGG